MQADIMMSCSEIPLTLEERLARFDPKKHGGVFMVTSQPQGAKGDEIPKKRCLIKRSFRSAICSESDS